MQWIYEAERLCLLGILLAGIVLVYQNFLKNRAKVFLTFLAHFELGLYTAMLCLLIFSVYADSYALFLFTIGLVFGAALLVLPRRIVGIGENCLIYNFKKIPLASVQSCRHRGLTYQIRTGTDCYTVYFPLSEYASLEQAIHKR